MSDTHMDKAAREKAREHLGEYATPFRETLREALDALDAADSDNARLQARVSELEAALANEREFSEALGRAGLKLAFRDPAPPVGDR